ncbi:hypothetical protein D3C73_651030 [compost metagenome]
MGILSELQLERSCFKRQDVLFLVMDGDSGMSIMVGSPYILAVIHFSLFTDHHLRFQLYEKASK